ncbi:hypothetical protein CLOP_g8827, partial [Closterium sp. NIES-67]
LGASSRPSGLSALLWSASPLAAAREAEESLAAAAAAAAATGAEGKRREFRYTVVRGGKVVDEPGRQKEVQLGQGDAIKGSISREDLAAVVQAALAVPPPPGQRRVVEVVNSESPRDSSNGNDLPELLAGLPTEAIVS